MRSFLAGLRQLVLPWGNSVGQARLVLGPDLPPPLSTYVFFGTVKAVAGVIYYSNVPGDSSYQFDVIVPVAGQHYLVRGAVQSGAVIEIGGPANPAGIVNSTSTNPAAPFTLALNASAIGCTTPTAFWNDPTSGKSYAFLSEAFGLRAADPTLPSTQEFWHILALQNGWTGTLAYKKNVSPAGTVSIASTNLNAGTKADNTLLATLPAALGYRPLTDMPVSMNAFGGVISTTQPPHLTVSSNGEIRLFGIGTSTVIQVNQFFPTDF